MSKRNQVQFSRPEDQKFLRLIKEQIGYKNEPSVDTKRQKLDQEFDDSSDSDDEQPQIVVTKSGDLSAEQVETEKRRIESENLTKPADLSQRIIFKRKSSKADKSSGIEKGPTVESSKKKEKHKNCVTSSKLSFALEDENTNSGAALAMVPNAHNAYINQTPGPKSSKTQQPSISITPLPRQPSNAVSSFALQATAAQLVKPQAASGGMKPGQSSAGGGKASFVICEICDGYIKDLDQLRNHTQWMHKVKIHPKMIYNRPPLNCHKCQFRFFTDQGLERHLLGSHGLVTSSMQEAANKGKDAGRCPVCGRMYQWKLLNHVSRDHNMTLKPAHLSYKCTVCTATFGMYKQFENHVYSAHN